MTPYDRRRRLVGVQVHDTDSYGDPDRPDWERPRIVAIARDRSQRPNDGRRPGQRKPTAL